jgi:hypothetical protein
MLTKGTENIIDPAKVVTFSLGKKVRICLQASILPSTSYHR